MGEEKDPLWWLDQAEIRVPIPRLFGRDQTALAYAVIDGREYDLSIAWEGSMVIPGVTLTFDSTGGYYVASGPGVEVVKTKMRQQSCGGKR